MWGLQGQAAAKLSRDWGGVWGLWTGGEGQMGDRTRAVLGRQRLWKWPRTQDVHSAGDVRTQGSREPRGTPPRGGLGVLLFSEPAHLSNPLLPSTPENAGSKVYIGSVF